MNKKEMPLVKVDDILALFSKEQFQEALDALEELISEKPNDALLFNIRGACFAGLGQIILAKENYEKAIVLNPEYSKAHFNLAGALHELDEFDASIRSYQDSIVIEPDHAEAHNNLGNVFTEVGQLDAAIKSYEKAICIKPDYIEAHYSLGNSFQESGKLEDAVKCFERVLGFRPNFTGMHNNLGNVLRELGRLDEAVLSYEKVISIDPDFFESYYNLGITFQEMNKLNYAATNYKKAIEIKPDYLDAYNNLGVIHRELEEFDSAIKCYKKIINIKPDDAEAHNSLGVLFMDTRQIDKAIESYKSAIKVNKSFIEAINNLGLAFIGLGQIDEAINYYQKAVTINPNFAPTYNNLGIAYKQILNHDAATKCYEKAITLDPNYSDAISNYGNLLTNLKNLDKALTQYEHAYELNPSANYMLGNILHTKMHLCLWSGLSNQLIELQNKIHDGKKVIDPFALLALIDDPEIQKKTSEINAQNKFPRSYLLPKIYNYSKHNKIRIGYFSPDFREHPVSTLTAELYETHDRSQFEIYAFSSGPNTKDEMNLRIKAGVDHFHDVSKMSHKEIAILSRSLEIDIAVDLGGSTENSRTEVFAMLAAPIQTSYIGYLGTMGADYYDYFIAAKGMIPKKNQKYFSEKIVYLPSYQVNDSKEPLPETLFSREDLGLPKDSFVFCCFNNTYKITPAVFDSWARILKEVEKSAMMIYASNKTAQKNLIKEITNRGVDPERLIFGENLPRTEYLSRYRLADLFLDTLPYNAGTTASDALRMGLPVLTCQGNSFASRVASSVINAVDLPELITDTQEGYESVAIELATNPEKYKSIKDKLKDNLSTATLYDTAKFTENLESAYRVMYERHHDGLKPDHIYINNSK